MNMKIILISFVLSFVATVIIVAIIENWLNRCYISKDRLNDVLNNYVDVIEKHKIITKIVTHKHCKICGQPLIIKESMFYKDCLCTNCVRSKLASERGED